MKKLLKNKINNNYKLVASIINTSEWGAKEIIENDGQISLDNLQKLFDYLGIELVDDPSKIIKYELSTEVNNKIFRKI